MAFRYSPKIVTDGLVLYLDAANPKSIISGSTVWNDISRGGNNGSLINGPTFNSGNGGSIVFDGNDDYMSINTPSSINLNNDITIDLWVKLISTGSNPRFIEIQDSLYSIQILIDGSSSKLATKHSKWETGFSCKFWTTPIINTWYNIVCVFTPSTSTTVFYQNGIELSSSNGNNVGIGNQSNKIILGVRSDFNSTTWLNSYLPNLKIYNKALSASEILQNYNTTKSKFGL